MSSDCFTRNNSNICGTNMTTVCWRPWTRVTRSRIELLWRDVTAFLCENKSATAPSWVYHRWQLGQSQSLPLVQLRATTLRFHVAVRQFLIRILSHVKDLCRQRNMQLIKYRFWVPSTLRFRCLWRAVCTGQYYKHYPYFPPCLLAFTHLLRTTNGSGTPLSVDDRRTLSNDFCQLWNTVVS